MSSKYQYFNGLKFTRDDKTGYYLNSTIRKRMHRYVWEFYNGPIPKGYDIHHKDENKANNDISNLEMIRKGKHQADHAKKWHGSKEGIEWHKEQIRRNPIKEKEFVCQCCKKKYISKPNGRNRFCSEKCKAKYYRMEKRAK